MSMLLAASSGNTSLLVSFLVSIASTGGLTGVIIAVAKLRGDTQSSAVMAAQGANEAMKETLEAIERERDYWRRRYDDCHERAGALAGELARLRRGETDESP